MISQSHDFATSYLLWPPSQLKVPKEARKTSASLPGGPRSPWGGLGSHYPKSTSDHPKGPAQHVCCIFVTTTYISTQRRSQGHTRVKAFSRCSCQLVFPSVPPLLNWSWKSWSPFTSPPRVLAVNSPLRVPRAPHPRAQMYNFRFETIDFTRPPVRQRLCTIPPRPPHPPRSAQAPPRIFPMQLLGGGLACAINYCFFRNRN